MRSVPLATTTLIGVLLLACGGSGGNDNGPAAPVFTTQPASVAVDPGSLASFTVGARGVPLPTYAWERSNDGGNTWNPIPGATGRTYTLAAVTITDSGAQFWAVVTNSVGTATSDPATLTVGNLPAPTFTTQPSNVTVAPGDSASFTVAAAGTPAPGFLWQRSNDGGTTWTTLNGAIDVTYILNPAQTADDKAMFRAVGTNSVGTATSNPAKLTVKPFQAPVISLQPKNMSGPAGTTVTFTFGFYGTPPPTGAWQRSDDKGVTWTTLSTYGTGGTATSGTSFSWSIAPQPADNGAQFRLLVSSPQGSLTSKVVTLTVS